LGHRFLHRLDLPDHLCVLYEVCAPFRESAHDPIGIGLGKLVPHDFLGLGHEVAGHEPQGVLRLRHVLIGQVTSVVAGEQDFRAAVGLGVRAVGRKTLDSRPLVSRFLAAQ